MMPRQTSPKLRSSKEIEYSEKIHYLLYPLIPRIVHWVNKPAKEGERVSKHEFGAILTFRLEH